MTTTPTDSQRRLRAVLRALMSTGVWLLVAAQLVYPLLRHSGFFAAGDTEPALGPTLVFGAIAVLVLYLQAGVFQALVRTREPVSMAEVIVASKDVFTDYVWLIVKAGLLFGLILAAVLTFILLASGDTPQALIPRLSVPLSVLFVVLPVLLLWWLPGAFVAREFRLVPSLRTAWRELTVNPARSVFPALLVLLPGLLLLLLPPSTPVALTLALDGAGMLLLWVADIYCLEWLKDSTPSVSAPS
jgi:hypothetical protein